MKIFRSASIVLAFVILCACFYACGGDEEPTYDLRQDLPSVVPEDFGPAPPFQLEDLNGNQVSLADFQGQVVAVNFWATWCGPCRREVPEFVEVQAEHQDDGFTILGISLDIEFDDNGNLIKNEEDVREFLEQFEVNYPV